MIRWGKWWWLTKQHKLELSKSRTGTACYWCSRSHGRNARGAKKTSTQGGYALSEMGIREGGDNELGRRYLWRDASWGVEVWSTEMMAAAWSLASGLEPRMTSDEWRDGRPAGWILHCQRSHIQPATADNYPGLGININIRCFLPGIAAKYSGRSHLLDMSSNTTDHIYFPAWLAVWSQDDVAIGAWWQIDVLHVKLTAISRSDDSKYNAFADA